MSGLPTGSSRAAPAMSPSDASHGLMSHVDIQHCVRPVDRPVGRSGIDDDGCAQVRAGRLRTPRLDGGKRSGIGLARLPCQIWEALRKPDGMLSGAAGHFQHRSMLRKPVSKHFGNRLAIAEGGRRRALGILAGGCFVKSTVAQALALAAARARLSRTSSQMSSPIGPAIKVMKRIGSCTNRLNPFASASRAIHRPTNRSKAR